MAYRLLPKSAAITRLVLLLGALVVTAACTPAGDSRPDDVLIIGQTSEPKSLDPHVTTALNDFRILVNIYEGLVRFRDGTLEPQPALARHWEISEDGLRYTFRLREGVRFHDGTPFWCSPCGCNGCRQAACRRSTPAAGSPIWFGTWCCRR
jgi:peptide/nickel transport system substrate-binding protein